ncbi:Rmp1p NDAI_0G02430 [Naumovozyma dairenensis CBS 421]|uniref:RNase MRP protein 1 RNA binding domain-containing protein n=1 Tax=Naumovozyma dairenensis (strain ATCC 10597 / BCRC 20456 / CBS 421 / NBRC 0211 / NRRL Y-12639) TaxID=1071378 RepID=G0WE07_NAUDC|nr:hypothetical protein NDAI_0G02430 [Naumovozyma dairenensis CBS 421]CCD26018.2 hypothetical protein NDAI_0G02430 [Naumovozyma dairenensis CBS 421]
MQQSLDSDYTYNQRYKDLYLKLHQEFRILHLLYHRNKNQHRLSIWWKRFNMLKRNCAQVIELIEYHYKQPEYNGKMTSSSSSKSKRQKQKIVIIRLYRLIHSMFSKRYLSKMYYDFNGIIALGQFVTLGVVLVGLLGRIYSIYLELFELNRNNFKHVGCIIKDIPINKILVNETNQAIMKSINQEELGEELGEEISIDDTMHNVRNTIIEQQLDDNVIEMKISTGIRIQENITTEHTIEKKKDNKIKKKKNKKSKSKSKSAIDSIFG